MNTGITLDNIKVWDEEDPHQHLRDQFCLAPETIYLDGNSLGPLPKNTLAQVTEVITQQWGVDLVGSWNKHQWIDKPQQLGNMIGQLIGAHEGQTLVCDSTSVNIFKLASAALKVNPKRTKVITEAGNFATDGYMLQGLQDLVGEKMDLHMVPSHCVEASIDDNTALVLLTHTHYKTGKMWDMQAITQRVHAKGALVLWDLSHSAGAMPLSLDAWQVDFAAGCGYKYLNGGPGAPSFLYVAAKHLDQIEQPLQGWLGHQAPFAFDDEYQPATGINRFMCGTPPILAYTALECALTLFDNVDLARLRIKAMNLTQLFIDLLSSSEELTLLSPAHALERGNQVAFQHPHGYAIIQNLIAQNIIGDFRAPNVMRFGFAPMFVRYQDVWQAAQALKEILTRKSYMQECFQTQQRVT